MSDPGTLPLHPSMRHPLTGAPVRALWVRPDGRVMWPLMGGAPDDPPSNNAGANTGTGGDQGGANGGAGTPPPANQDTGNQTGQQQKPPEQGNTGEADKGFPADTPLAEMTPAQQAAYWKDKAQVHETRNKDLLKITDGKYGDELKTELAELKKLKDQNLTESERAVEAAKAEARTSVLAEVGNKLAAAEFRAALAHVDGERRERIIGRLNLPDFITEDGDVDTAKVRETAADLAPTGKDAGNTQRHDYGAGRRGGSNATGVSAGADMYAASRKKTTTS